MESPRDPLEQSPKQQLTGEAPKARCSVSFDGRVALSVSEAAAALGVSERHLRSFLPEIPRVHLGSRVIIPLDSLREWLRERAAQEKAQDRKLMEDLIRGLGGKP